MDDSNLDENGWNDGANYDRIEHLLQDVDGTKEDAEVALTGAKNNKKENFIHDVCRDIKNVVRGSEVNQI